MYDGAVVLPLKSAGIAALLAALFGPVGLFYGSLAGGFVMTGLTVVVGALGMIYFSGGHAVSFDPVSLWFLLVAAEFLAQIFLVITWPVCIVCAILGAKAHNRKLLYGMDDDLWS